MKKFKYRGYDSNATEQRGSLEVENYSETYAELSERHRHQSEIRIEGTRS